MKEKKERVYFENIQYHIIRILEASRVSVKICVAWITWDVYAPVLKKLAARGVEVKIIYNNDDKNMQSEILGEVDGVALFPISARKYGSLMHNKFCMVDDALLMTGSFNWSRTAQSHFENIVILENHYELIKKFNHEFDDLLHYFESYKNKIKIICGSADDGSNHLCRSHAYHVGVLGGSSGIDESSTVSVWKICNSYKHAQKLSATDEIFINSTLLGVGDDYEHYETAYDIEAMREDYVSERRKVEKIRKYFERRHKIRIHAVGIVGIVNEGAYLKGYESPECALQMIWTDMYYRKIIPSEIYDWDSDDIEDLIKEVNDSSYS